MYVYGSGHSHPIAQVEYICTKSTNNDGKTTRSWLKYGCIENAGSYMAAHVAHVLKVLHNYWLFAYIYHIYIKKIAHFYKSIIQNSTLNHYLWLFISLFPYNVYTDYKETAWPLYIKCEFKKKWQLVYILKSLKMVKEKRYFKDGSFLDQGKLSVKINR